MNGEPDVDTGEHERTGGNARGWLILVAACAVLIGWGLVIFSSVRDAPRQWDFGALPDVPGESIYSIQSVPPPLGGTPPRMMAPLPDSVPLTQKTAPAPQASPGGKAPAASQGTRP